MADVKTATATQLQNIQTKTAKSFAQLCALIQQSGLTKVGEQRAMLMQTLGLGYGDANTLALLAKQAETAPAADALAAIYAGPKAPLRALHDQLSAAIDAMGAHEKAPKKGYISLRRGKQFAMLGPATKTQIELGLNAKDLPSAPRLRAMPPGGMCQYTVRIASSDEIDDALLAWVRSAFDAAA